MEGWGQTAFKVLLLMFGMPLLLFHFFSESPVVQKARSLVQDVSESDPYVRDYRVRQRIVEACREGDYQRVVGLVRKWHRLLPGRPGLGPNPRTAWAVLDFTWSEEEKLRSIERLAMTGMGEPER